MKTYKDNGGRRYIETGEYRVIERGDVFLDASKKPATGACVWAYGRKKYYILREVKDSDCAIENISCPYMERYRSCPVCEYFELKQPVKLHCEGKPGESADFNFSGAFSTPTVVFEGKSYVIDGARCRRVKAGEVVLGKDGRIIRAQYDSKKNEYPVLIEVPQFFFKSDVEACVEPAADRIAKLEKLYEAVNAARYLSNKNTGFLDRCNIYVADFTDILSALEDNDLEPEPTKIVPKLGNKYRHKISGDVYALSGSHSLEVFVLADINDGLLWKGLLNSFRDIEEILNSGKWELVD